MAALLMAMLMDGADEEEEVILFQLLMDILKNNDKSDDAAEENGALVPMDYDALCKKNSDETFKLHFRFAKEDIPRLATRLRIPRVKCPFSRCTAGPVEALLYLLKRHAYPCRWIDLKDFFGRRVSQIAGVVCELMRFLLKEWVDRIVKHIDIERVTPAKLQEFADAIERKCEVPTLLPSSTELCVAFAVRVVETTCNAPSTLDTRAGMATTMRRSGRPMAYCFGLLGHLTAVDTTCICFTREILSTCNYTLARIS